MYSEPKFEIIELGQEDILTESNKWNYQEQIEIDGIIEFQ